MINFGFFRAQKKEDLEILKQDFDIAFKDFDKLFDDVKKVKEEQMAKYDHDDLKSKTPIKESKVKPLETKNEGGKRYDVGKLRYDLLPVDAMRELVKVYTKGAEKYADRNWEKGMSWSRVIGPLMRHLEAFRQGEIWDDGIDPVTGQPCTGCHHMAMVAWNALALVTYQMRGIGTNDLGWEHYITQENKKD